MKVELFKIDPATRMVDLNKEWISTIKEFKKILNRDRGSKGDMSGAKKLQATREFTFIYHFCDYASKFDNYSEEDKLQQCIQNAELEATFDYTKDEELLAAMVRYTTMQESPSLKILKEAQAGLHTTHKVLKKIRVSIETKLETTDFDEIETKEEPEIDSSDKLKWKDRKPKVDDPVTKLSKALIALMSLTNQVGPALQNIRELEEQVKKELGDKASLRGDKVKGAREDAIHERVSESTEEKQTMFD